MKSELTSTPVNFGGFETIRESAKSFYKIAKIIHEQQPTGIDDAAKWAKDNFSTYTVFATNLIFSSELYLKAIHTLWNHPIPHSHNLIEVFASLPKSDREKLITEFDNRCETMGSQFSNYILVSSDKKTLTESDVERFFDGTEIKNSGTSLLEKVLSDTGDSYKWWRYNFEGPGASYPERVVVFHTDYLLILCELVDEALSSSEGY